MRTLFISALALAMTALFAAPVHAGAAEDLFKETHRGAKDSKVANDWWDKLPQWAAGLVSRNEFPRTHLPMEFQGDRLRPSREANKFEIRDANNRMFKVHMMYVSGTDANGLPNYEVSETNGWVRWNQWPAKYIVETYPVESNRDDNDVVAFAAWLYEEREGELANRVLTVLHQRNKDLAPLIEAYICEKERWELPEDGMKIWSEWDIEYQKERKMLLTPSVYDKRLEEREKAAKDAFKELQTSRGDYQGKAPRRRPPTKQLVLIEWDIRQFERKFGGSDFFKEEETVETLQNMKDSIKDDLQLIKDRLAKAEEIIEDKSDPNPNNQEEKAQFMEEIMRIDPMDMNLRAKVADAWYQWANPADHGNSCDRVQGMKKAIPHYEAILEKYPNNTSILLRVGKAYQAQEDSSNARGYYERVIELDPNRLGKTAKALIRNMEMKDASRAKRKGNGN